MSFLIDLSESLFDESRMDIIIKTVKDNVVIKVLDFEKKGIKGVELILHNDVLGKTDPKGELLLDKKIFPRKGVIKAAVGIYRSSKSFQL